MSRFHEFSGIRSAKGLTPWQRCTCGAVAESHADIEFHTDCVVGGVSGPKGKDGFLYAPIPRPDNERSSRARNERIAMEALDKLQPPRRRL